MAQALAVTLAATAAVSTNASGTAADIAAIRKIARVVVRALAKSGERVLTLTLQTRAADTEAWRDVGTIMVDAVRDYTLTVGPLSRYVRASWAFADGGSDTVTFECTAEAHQVYILPSDMVRLSIPEKAFNRASESEKLDACITATDEADGYIGAGYTLPLTAWGDDVRKHTSALAARTLVQKRGVDPSGADAGVLDMRDEALRWFVKLGAGQLSPPGLVDSTVDEYEGGAYLSSDAPRGW